MKLFAARVFAAVSALAVLLFFTAPGRAQFVPLPAGWHHEFGTDRWTLQSPPSDFGSVNILVPLAQPADAASFETEFGAAVEELIRFVGGRIVRRSPQTHLGDRQEYPVYIRFDTRSQEGIELTIAAYGQNTNNMPVDPILANRLQTAFVVAPTAVFRSNDGRWEAGEKLVERFLLKFAKPLTPELLALALRLEAEGGSAAAAAQATAPQATQPATTATPATMPALPAATPQQPVIWSARGYGTGLTLVSPCSADGVSILAALRRREYVQAVDLPSFLVDEARATIREWTGSNASPSFSGVRQEGAALTTTANFQTAAGRQVAWFAAIKRPDNYLQRGYVVADAQLGSDPRLGTAADAVLRMMQNNDLGELEIEGNPPAASTSTDVEGVFAFSRLAFALDGKRLDARPIEIALFRNGAATETSNNLSGYWQRVEGGYSVEFEGGEGYVARVSEACRTGTTTASRPAPAAPARGSARNCFGQPITVDFRRAVGVTRCTTIGGRQTCRIETDYVSSPTTFRGCR